MPPLLSSTFFLLLIALQLHSTLVASATVKFNFQIKYATVTRLCHTKTLVSVNGQFPGPTQYVSEGDTVIVKVTNMVSDDITIHWHGVRQLLTAWADGPAYITQCPIQAGETYVHKFTVVGQRGTLFWHAHISWQRSTLYGAFIIRPKSGASLPFTAPSKELPPLLLGEWWNANVEDVIAQALATGGAYNISDALTINGQPGALYNCSKDGTFTYTVIPGQTYLLRIINAALNFQLYFSIANHALTVVEADAEYTQPYTTNVILLAPGQTTNVLFTASSCSGAQFYMAASVFSPAPISMVPFPQTPATAILQCGNPMGTSSSLTLPSFPVFNDTAFAAAFLNSLKSQAFSSGYYYMDVPQQVDLNLLYTVGYSLQPCPPGMTCVGPSGNKMASSVSNISFNTPTISLLQAYYDHINGVYQANFPDNPVIRYSYTSVNPANKYSTVATEVRVLPFNTTVQLVFQNTATLFFESHPMHLHGQSFWIVGSGSGNFVPTSDPAKFNLNNPPSRNTIAVPAGGWVAVRFRAINPGVWYLHCHLDIHQSWGMSMAFVVQNGAGSAQTLLPPPSDLPPC